MGATQGQEEGLSCVTELWRSLIQEFQKRSIIAAFASWILWKCGCFLVKLGRSDASL